MDESEKVTFTLPIYLPLCGPIADGKIYTSEAIKVALSGYAERVLTQNGVVIPLILDPAEIVSPPNIEHIAAVVREIRVDAMEVDLEVLATPRGKILYELLDSGAGITTMVGNMLISTGIITADESSRE